MESPKGLYVTEITPFEQHIKIKRPLLLVRTPAGFPSPADDYIDKKLDLNELCIKNPSATYFVKVQGESMKEAGIFDGDTLIVDRALDAENNDIVVAVLNGDLLVAKISGVVSQQSTFAII